MLNAQDLFDQLKEYPHRGVGTQEEMLAREELMAMLSGEPGVDIKEEGLYVPRSYIGFFWFIFIGLSAFIWTAPFAPIWSSLGAVIVGTSYFLFMDWRQSPLIWWTSKKVASANLVAQKSSIEGDKGKLIILMAHLDSAPASFAYRRENVRRFRGSVYLSLFIVLAAVWVPVLMALGFMLPNWVLILMTAVLSVQGLIANIDFWIYGFVPGANDNLSGVVVATETATRLWTDMPEDTEIRLLITTGEEAGMLGAQDYLKTHQDELLSRDSSVVNIDTVGYGQLAYVEETGGITHSLYHNRVTEAAKSLSAFDKRFNHIRRASHHVGDFDSVWFNRAGIPSVTLAAYDDEGLMPYIHTPEDRAAYVEPAAIKLAVDYSEALVRSL